MTGLFPDHPLFFSGTLFVLLVVVIPLMIAIVMGLIADLDSPAQWLSQSVGALGFFFCASAVQGGTTPTERE
jgi:hypothetical protein